MLRFVLDDLSDLGRFDGGQLDELGKYMEARGADIDILGAHALLGEHLLERLLEVRFPRLFLGSLFAQ